MENENKFEQWLKQHPGASLWECYAANHDAFNHYGKPEPELAAWLKTLSKDELEELAYEILCKAYHVQDMADKIYRYLFNCKKEEVI